MAEDFKNPLPGDEFHEICVLRQVERGVDNATANRVCKIMSTILPANGFEKESDMILVPVKLTAEGVHNGFFKPWSAIKDSYSALLGAPVFANQPGEHENDAWPPVKDKTRWHGLIVQVEADDERKEVPGIVGLFKPETLRKNGASEERVKFQEGLLKAIEAGGKFAISTHYGARMSPKSGVYKSIPYRMTEEKLEFNSISLVPRGAEPSAIMNADTTYWRNEVLNTDAEEKPSTPMALDAEWVKSANLDSLIAASPEVRRLHESHSQLLREHDALKASANADKTRAASVDADMATIRTALESGFKTNEPDMKKLVTGIVQAHANAVKDLTMYRERETKAFENRITAAKKALANSFNEAQLKPFLTDGDLAGNASRLEALANALGPAAEIVPPTEELTGEEPVANFSKDDDVESLENRAFSGFQRIHDSFSNPKEAMQ